MSAFVVDMEHIHLLVRVAMSGPRDGEHHPGDRTFPLRFMTEGPSGPELSRVVAPGQAKRSRGDLTPSELGAILFAENVRSVMHRYPDTIDGGDVPGTGEEWAQPYHYLEPGYVMTCAEAAKAISCLTYQSCEHPEWRESQAHSLLGDLLERVASVLPGIGEAPWMWNERHLAERARRV